MKYIITTANNSDTGSLALAEQLAKRLDKPLVPRNKRSLQVLRESYDVDHLLVVGRNRVTLVTREGEYYFHPSMSKLRIKQIKKGCPDPMIQVMDLKQGDSLLDCTLGLASDALVSSFVSGPSGRVVGLEGVDLLAALVESGLQTYQDDDPEVTAAARKIEVKPISYLKYLESLPDKSFDIVYFDPMFRRPKIRSSAMNPLRGITIGDAVIPEAIIQGCRVARKRVVLKETNGSPEFARLGFTRVEGGKYSPVAYGVIIL